MLDCLLAQWVCSRSQAGRSASQEAASITMAMISPDCSLLSRVLKSFNPPSFLKLEGLKAPCRPSLVSKIQKKARTHGAYLQRESHQTQPVRTVPERALGDVQGLYFMPTTPISRISTGRGRYNTPTLLHPRLTVGQTFSSTLSHSCALLLIHVVHEQATCPFAQT